MLYPGEDDASQKRARAWAAQFLAEPVQRFLEARGTLAHEELARLHADSRVSLDDLKVRWRDGTVARLPVTSWPKPRSSTGGERAKAEPPLSAEAWRVPDGGRHRSLSRLRPHLTMPEDLLVDLKGPGRPRK